MSATNVLQPAPWRRRSAVFGVEDFLTLALGALLAFGLINAAPRLVDLLASPVVSVAQAASNEDRADDEAASAGEALAAPLSPRLRNALDSVSRRYRVAPEAVRPIFSAAQAAGRSLHLDPLLIIAVIGVESGFNPFSQSVMGAQGLMQVIPRFHQEKIPEGAGNAPLLDPVTNVLVGARVLKESIARNGGVIEGLQQFAGASDDPDQRYANRVLAEKQRLEQALLAARKG